MKPQYVPASGCVGQAVLAEEMVTLDCDKVRDGETADEEGLLELLVEEDVALELVAIDFEELEVEQIVTGCECVCVSVVPHVEQRLVNVV
ncbi:hypothetical protein Tdes44962_MAKER08073 [Teratosphaeria destructans]|uniref:Uncharacterized protein n=1 Tax=Teratosphaeria destructans TaxID=418781 RepID=A0A9W7W5G6_9PEZI|nr:hypothetical protein Tdes44962_MAKER08073 [Teratosphaeria destructans]